MKAYIDGENFRHRLVKVLADEGLIASSNSQFSFDVHTFPMSVINEDPEDSIYYTTKIKLPRFKVPHKLTKRISAIQETNRRWIAELTDQGIRIVKAGYLKVRESNACIHCGKKTLVLQEKGVDVRLATDVVMAAVQEKAKRLAIISSDADMIPALEVAERAGAKITYVCFAEELNRAIAAVVSQTVTYTRKDIIDAYKRNETKHGRA